MYEFYDAIAYRKAGAIMNMLREYIGDEVRSLVSAAYFVPKFQMTHSSYVFSYTYSVSVRV